MIYLIYFIIFIVSVAIHKAGTTKYYIEYNFFVNDYFENLLNFKTIGIYLNMENYFVRVIK